MAGSMSKECPFGSQIRDAACSEDRCAWWNDDLNACAITALPVALKVLEKCFPITYAVTAHEDN